MKTIYRNMGILQATGQLLHQRQYFFRQHQRLLYPLRGWVSAASGIFACLFILRMGQNLWSPVQSMGTGKFKNLSTFTHILNTFHPKGSFSTVRARSMRNHPGGRFPREIAGGKAQRLVPWQGEDKLSAGEGERWSQPKAINSFSGVLQSNTGEEKEMSW